MFYKVLLLLVGVAVAAADSPPYGYSAPQSEESMEAKYDFNWAVNDQYSGNNFGHQETRDGDNTQGSYYVQLPDGRLQKVTYYVDGDSGFVADVQFEGEAQYPESEESRESPRYAAPRPSYSAPEAESSEESRESPRYAAPRPSYSAPEAESSEESPIYAPAPRPTYVAPRPTYVAPRPTYAQPKRTYGFKK